MRTTETEYLSVAEAASLLNLSEPTIYRPRTHGSASEFLAWAINRNLGSTRAVELSPDAPPPALNYPGRGLSFRISGFRDDEDGMEPQELVDKLRQYWAEELFVPASILARFEEHRPSA